MIDMELLKSGRAGQVVATDIVRMIRAAGAAVPRVHGNGMIQLDLPPEYGEMRLHFWGSPRIPRQRVYTPIHDHNWSFRSEVLFGALTNVEYSSHAGRLFQVWKAVPREGSDTALQATGWFCHLKVERVDHVRAGGSYLFDACKFHETIIVEPTVTLMQRVRVERKDDGPYVLVRAGEEPDNAFDRNAFSLSLLWDVIDEMLDGQIGGA